MRKSNNKTGMGVGAIIVVMAAVLVGGYFGKAVVGTFFNATELHDFPTSTSSAVVVKDDPAVHKAFKKLMANTHYVGSYEVAYPSRKDFRISAHVSSKDNQETANQMGAIMGATWAYLTDKGADPKTRITMTITDGNLKVYDLTAFGLEAKPTFKDFGALVKRLIKLAS